MTPRSPADHNRQAHFDAIRQGVRAVVTRFDDEYWLQRDDDGEFPSGFHRAMADGGEANRAVTELVAKVLGVAKAKVRILSGTTSRHKQIAVDGDPAKLGAALRELTALKKD